MGIHQYLELLAARFITSGLSIVKHESDIHHGEGRVSPRCHDSLLGKTRTWTPPYGTKLTNAAGAVMGSL
jgi:hypothetical protein